MVRESVHEVFQGAGFSNPAETGAAQRGSDRDTPVATPSFQEGVGTDWGSLRRRGVDPPKRPWHTDPDMAASSTMLDLGTPLPAFALPDATTGKLVDSESLADAVLVIALFCNHCPYVKHIQSAFVAFAREYPAVRIVAISSNDVAAYPQDGPTAMAAEARKAGYAFPYLYDETQAVAKALHAACTPEFYVFARDGKLAYRGRFDASTPKNGEPVTGRELRAALDAVLRGAAPSIDQHPSIGCSIKWKDGNEPGY